MKNWTEQIEKLSSKLEAVNFNNKEELLVKKVIEDSFFETLSDYLQLDSFTGDKKKQAWVVILLLYIIKSYSANNKIVLENIISTTTSSLYDITCINSALEVLMVHHIITIVRKSPGTRTLIKTNIDTISNLLSAKKLPAYPRETLLSKLTLARIKKQKLTPQKIFSNEFKEILDDYLNSDEIPAISALNKIDNIKDKAKYLMGYLIALYHNPSGYPEGKNGFFIKISSRTDNFIIALQNNKTILNDMKFIRVDHVFSEYILNISLTIKALRKLGISNNKNSSKENLTPAHPLSKRRTGSARKGWTDFEIKEKGNLQNEFIKIIKNKNIEKEELFYSDKLKKDLFLYVNLLKKDDRIFKDQPALKGKILLMFDGLPGTGKTAFANQMARLTGRDIVHVNWQTINDSYIGASEKNLKGVLMSIDEMSKSSKRSPVVIFNEAESFLGKRMEVRHFSDQMGNNMVAMLLEWLEKKDPFNIIIFTANHKQIMDKAFERRITNIHFDLPDANTRLKIWAHLTNKFNIDLNSNDFVEYKLTGAEISKILRNYSLHKIAYDIEGEDLKMLHHLCGGEKWMENTRIGFKA